MEAAIAEANRLIDTCHERVGCPRCGAPVGVRCRRMPRGYRPLDLDEERFVIKTPHKQRLRAAGIFVR